MWNNPRVNSIIGSLYDDNKPFTEQILTSEEKRERLGAWLNTYIFYWNPLLLTNQIHFETIHWNDSIEMISMGEVVNLDHDI